MRRRDGYGAWLLVLLVWIGTARAAALTDHQIVGDLAIYFGVLPAELVRGHPREHPESEMHGGIAVGDSHVIVALFDNKTGKRISGAQILAHVTGAAGVEVKRPLEAMVVAGRAAYGNYFPLKGAGPFRIELRIRSPGAERDTQAMFTWARS